ncbi:MAG: organoarsenical effux MFS transporter ArsJ [Candidatus Thiodiazotropha lotti]|uniref:organoarsenical effux MFS transporter ArsJ n=1 Tax=Candidatus Thiodiazotropha endoloripes TaxID=1818881 RepID=UPI00083E28B7|nr:organoarsenical effux MFS transporter ArsJ [Candidatus Thiodiazotropha endoloripes]MCG7903913.1 organoarsenical effux MFS transporter ArsJ [Candidatus Thiodiazotropha weberae]MCG7993154.1 organoarsenical effux MFS transporter ArsJ [Candidatus Thiodiazotropha lotti]MCG7915450.1 organoarsenical effux MFS transporter ArsJ [Candidatus Thiodiazotropha weberae]MCG8000760.1 organoarsenical effux MFS transporter ArsJ [Candidatus Thiodiazotropha lotti]MCW4184816.1 organoarsenical effux MFS transport
MDQGVRNYLVVTGGYWAFTITDGAIRMLVVLYFHLLGYSPFEVAMLFLFYEFFGIVTNLVGGWLGARIGLNLTMHIGMGLQVVALMALTVPDAWLSVIYVMIAQALSGIAKDLNKMSAKASVKTMVRDGGESKLFKWVALLTGSKNALKGAGYFIGAALLEWIGFRGALAVLAGMLLLVLIATSLMLPAGLGKMKSKPKFSQVFSKVAAINWLSAARFFLFGSRDVWFVVGLPVFLYEVLDWSFTQVGGFLALWIIGYGFVQASVPKLLGRVHQGQGPGGGTARLWAFLLALLPAAIAMALNQGWPAEQVLVVGLILFGIVFAINSAVHSYLILAYSDHEKVSMNVGFYYMANAGGRLIGTVLSGLIYQTYGLQGCLWWSALFVILAALLSFGLPEVGADEKQPLKADSH